MEWIPLGLVLFGAVGSLIVSYFGIDSSSRARMTPMMLFVATVTVAGGVLSECQQRHAANAADEERRRLKSQIQRGQDEQRARDAEAAAVQSGGDGAPYVTLRIDGHTARTGALTISNISNYPLYNVRIAIIDLEKQARTPQAPPLAEDIVTDLVLGYIPGISPILSGPAYDFYLAKQNDRFQRDAITRVENVTDDLLVGELPAGRMLSLRARVSLAMPRQRFAFLLHSRNGTVLQKVWMHWTGRSWLIAWTSWRIGFDQPDGRVTLEQLAMDRAADFPVDALDEDWDGHPERAIRDVTRK